MSELAALPLLELRIEPARGEGSELRVRADGRFEVRTAGDGWKLISEYSAGELDELRSEMERADDPPLPQAIAGAGGSNPTRMTWRLRLADELREVVVEEWRDGVSPPLERLYRKLFTIPRGPSVESVWRVRVDGSVVERRVVGEAAGVPALAPMLAALYRRPDPFEPARAGEEGGSPAGAGEEGGSPAGAGEAPGELLVDVRHVVDGAPGDRLAIAPDGRAFLTEGGETTEVKRLDAQQLATLREAIAQTGWPALPDPLVADPAP